MQKKATTVFIYSSIIFGVLGVLMVLNLPGPGKADNSSPLHVALMKMLMMTGFIVLSSFALSVAGKYLDQK